MSEFPSFQEQIQNFVEATTKATQEAMSGGDIFVSTEVQKQRLLICSVCDQLDSATARCIECGCFVQIKSKVTTEECPLGKWGEDYVDPSAPRAANPDVPTPPDNPAEGDIYVFKGKVWQFKDDEWRYVPQKKVRGF